MMIIQMKIEGLSEFISEIEDAQKAMEALASDIGSVNYDPHDPSCIESAIRSVETMIDGKVGSYSQNAIIGPMIMALKEQYRSAIIEHAAASRLASDE